MQTIKIKEVLEEAQKAFENPTKEIRRQLIFHTDNEKRLARNTVEWLGQGMWKESVVPLIGKLQVILWKVWLRNLKELWSHLDAAN